MNIEEIKEYARLMVATGWYFQDARSKDEAEARAVITILFGLELGLPPGAALRGVQVIKGRPTLSAGLIADRIAASGRVSFEDVERTTESCRLAWYRDSIKVGESQFTIEDAKRAGLTGGNWSKYPRQMLFARCLTEGQRVYAADVFSGSMYTTEELEVVQASESPQAKTLPAPQKPPREVARDEARARMVAVVKSSSVDTARVFAAIKAKVGKPSEDMTAEEFAEVAGIVRAHDDNGTLDKWCRLMVPPSDEAVDAEVVDDPADEAHSPWDKASKALHAEWRAYCEKSGDDDKGDAYKVMHDAVRGFSGLPPDAPWHLVTVEAMDNVRNHLKKPNLAMVALSTEWAEAAKERGAL